MIVWHFAERTVGVQSIEAPECWIGLATIYRKGRRNRVSRGGAAVGTGDSNRFASVVGGRWNTHQQQTKCTHENAMSARGSHL